MKKNLNDILDEMTPEELDKLSAELKVEQLPDEVVSSVKEKVYAKTNIENVAKTKRDSRAPRALWIRVGALAACFALIVGAIALLPTLREDENFDVISTGEPQQVDNKGTSIASAVATTVAATKKEGTPQKPFGGGSFEGEGVPPPMFLFDQPEDFPKFVAAAGKTEEEFEEYYNTEIHTAGILIYPSEREPVAHNLEIVYLPVTSSDIAYERFWADYNLYSNVLDIIYKIDGVRYRFTYEYNKDTLPDLSEREVVLSDVYLGDFLIDLYKGSECLFGYFLDDSVLVGVTICTSDFEGVSLDAFDMVPVASIK